ncbi:MAG: NAD(+)/NADH kinase [Planctomycetia bacterium]|nr:NAD(+)/NADH kinase [Planctomycetia bacterium]
MDVIHQKTPGVVLLGDQTRVREAGLLEVLLALSPDVTDALQEEDPGVVETSPGTATPPDTVTPSSPERTREAIRPEKSRTGTNGPGLVDSQTAKAIYTSLLRYTRVLGVDFSDDPFSDELLRRGDLDFAICFGGDGTVLRAAKRLQSLSVPLLAVNLGHLGFLADVAPEELAETLSVLAWGVTSRLRSHLMLRCRVLRRPVAGVIGSATQPDMAVSPCPEDPESDDVPEMIALNEVAVQTGTTFRQIDLRLAIDGETVAYYSGDGLILATPVGSTAHTLSAGGPIIRHTLESVLICPLNPHTLTMRPVVDSAERRYVITVIQADPGTSVVVDGVVLTPLSAGDRIEITRSERCFRTIMPPRHSYYQTLREKLGWSGRFAARRDDAGKKL